MLLTVLLLAAAVAAAPASPAKGDVLVRPLDARSLTSNPACRARWLAQAQVLAKAAKARPDSRSTAPRNPKGQYAVIRTVDGCGVPTPMK